jgi:hypothetical protein
MRFSLYSLVRLTAIVVLAATSMGVAVRRLTENPLAGLVVDHAQPWTVAQHVIDPERGRNLILETGSDRPVSIDFGPDTSIDLLSVSPFVDAQGMRQIVGRRQVVRGDGAAMTPMQIEMTRLRFPDGAVLDAREADWIPNCMPAWDVRLERGLKTVFATGGGFLVRMDWTDDQGLSASHRGEKIEWAVRPPLGEQTSIGEPVWMTDPRFPDRLIVTFWGQDERSGDYRVGLAWIELNVDRTAIVGSGELTSVNLGRNRNAVSVRSPSLQTDSDGVTHLLWMKRVEGSNPWTLLKSNLLVQAGGEPNSRPWRLGEVSEVFDACLPVPARLDTQSDYVYYVVPKSHSCYDGGHWRKSRMTAGGAALALRLEPHAEPNGMTIP